MIRFFSIFIFDREKNIFMEQKKIKLLLNKEKELLKIGSENAKRKLK